ALDPRSCREELFQFPSNETESAQHFPQPCGYLRSLLQRSGPAPPKTLLRWPAHCVRQSYVCTSDNLKTVLGGIRTESLHPRRTLLSGSRCETFRKVSGARLERKLELILLHTPVMPVENPQPEKR